MEVDRQSCSVCLYTAKYLTPKVRVSPVVDSFENYESVFTSLSISLELRSVSWEGGGLYENGQCCRERELRRRARSRVRIMVANSFFSHPKENV